MGHGAVGAVRWPRENLDTANGDNPRVPGAVEMAEIFEVEKGNRPVSRVLSRTVIPLRRLSPGVCSDLPRSRADHTSSLLYLVLLRAGLALPRLLPAARCALTAPFHPCRFLRTWAVYFLWHFPSACAAQALPGALSYGARTFLHTAMRYSDRPAGSRRVVSIAMPRLTSPRGWIERKRSPPPMRGGGVQQFTVSQGSLPPGGGGLGRGV